MNTTNSNVKPGHLFPELPPTKVIAAVGVSSGKVGGVYRVGASRLGSVCLGVVVAAVRFFGQPLLRLPVIEFTAILVMFAMFLFSLG